MPIVGMVLVLEGRDAETRRAVSASLASDSDLVLGDPTEHRWPAVLDAPDERGAEERIDRLRRVPGIAGVDVVYADFEDLLDPAARSGRKES